MKDSIRSLRSQRLRELFGVNTGFLNCDGKRPTARNWTALTTEDMTEAFR